MGKLFIPKQFVNPYSKIEKKSPYNPKTREEVSPKWQREKDVLKMIGLKMILMKISSQRKGREAGKRRRKQEK
jgi:hypothetical protein